MRKEPSVGEYVTEDILARFRAIAAKPATPIIYVDGPPPSRRVRKRNPSLPKHQRPLRASPTRQTHDRRPLGGAHGSGALKGGAQPGLIAMASKPPRSTTH